MVVCAELTIDSDNNIPRIKVMLVIQGVYNKAKLNNYKHLQNQQLKNKLNIYMYIYYISDYTLVKTNKQGKKIICTYI